MHFSVWKWTRWEDYRQRQLRVSSDSVRKILPIVYTLDPEASRRRLLIQFSNGSREHCTILQTIWLFFSSPIFTCAGFALRSLDVCMDIAKKYVLWNQPIAFSFPAKLHDDDSCFLLVVVSFDDNRTANCTRKKRDAFFLAATFS